MNPIVYEGHNDLLHEKQLSHVGKVQKFINRAANELRAPEIGVDFDVAFAAPWRVLTEPERNPYAMPPFGFIVYGWNVGGSTVTKSIDVVAE